MNDETSTAASVENRRLAAIMFTDIVGFSRQMSTSEARTLRLLDTHNQMIQKAVAEYHGTIIKTVGDAFLVDFPSVVHAVQCAQQIQAQFRAHNAEKEATEQIHVRIGIHSGDIVQRDGDVFGDGVNIASRLQGLAEPDTICISQAVYKEIEKKLPTDTVVSLGRPKLKNIAQREPVYVLLPEMPEGFRQRLHVRRLKLTQWRRALQVVAAVLVLVWAGAVTLRSFRWTPPLEQSQGATPTDAAPLPLPDKPSIVVLPFVNMSNDPEQEYFSDGITEDITTDLSKISSLFVIARNSAFTYKGKVVKVQDVSKEMGVRYVLEGSVRKSDNQVRITTQLIDATTGGHLWSERYDRPLKDIFVLQDEIVRKIVTTLKLQLSLLWQGVDISRRTTDSPEAWDYHLRGMEALVRFTKEANVKARQMFEKAVELDSGFAGAYSGLGWTYYMEWSRRWNQNPQALERAFALAQKATALNDSLPGAHLLLGWIYIGRKQHEYAIAEAERVLALDPNSADGYAMFGQFLSFAGRPEEAIGLIQKAMRLNPRYPVLYEFYLGYAYWLTRQHEEALKAHKRALVRNPDYQPSQVNLAVLYSELGRETEAQVTVASLIEKDPNFSLDVVGQTWSYNRDPTVLERILAALRKAGLK